MKHIIIKLLALPFILIFYLAFWPYILIYKVFQGDKKMRELQDRIDRLEDKL